jgi:hypothetical protein
VAGDFIDGIVKRRGGGDDAPAPAAPKASYGAVKGDALGTLARILGVGKGDRAAFDSAMTDLVEACMEDEEKETPAEEDAEPDTGDAADEGE